MTDSPDPGSSRRKRISTGALYGGGLMGPFAAGIVASILPELGASFDRTADQAAVAIPAYFVPFALAMLVSGTLGQRWGVPRTVAGGYLLFVAATVLAALSPNWELFQLARGLQGLANAFTTPLLLATLGLIAPRQRIGAALGLFAAMQSVGQVFAPLFGGLFAHFSWRWAFGVVALAGVLLLVAGVPRPERAPATARPGLRAAWTWPVLRLCLVYFVVGAALTGLAFLVALYTEQHFGLGSGERGLLLTGAGVLAILTSRTIGRQVDRRGWVRVGFPALLLGVATLGLMPVFGSVAAVAVLWALTGVSNQGILVALNSRVLALPGAAGAVSVAQAARFLGTAAAPLLVLPVYRVHPDWGFWLPAMAVAAAAVLVVTSGPRTRAAG
ncbi:MFS transporter [Nakamurella silvestris]|nr:MFS transporter [Nakamurella silvestris]